MLYCRSFLADVSKEHLAIPPCLYWLSSKFRFVLHIKQTIFPVKDNLDLIKDTKFCAWISP